MKILFYVKASDTYGWGHLIRISKIIKKLNRRNQCSVLIEGNENTISYLKKKKIKIFYHIKKSFFSEKSNFKKEVEELSPDIIFIDMLKINEHHLKFLKEKGKSKIVVFSDLGVSYKEANLIICPNPKDLWKQKNDKKIIGGIEYVIVPKKKIQKLNEKNKKDIFINTGGTTNRKTFTKMFKILKFLDNYNFTGTYFLGNVENFNPYDKKYQIRGFQYVTGIEPLFKLVNKYKIAFVTAGYIRYELLYLNFPMILTSISDHQTLFGQWFKKNKICEFIGPLAKINLDKLLKSIKLLKLENKKDIVSENKVINFDSNAEQRILNLCKRI